MGNSFRSKYGVGDHVDIRNGMDGVIGEVVFGDGGEEYTGQSPYLNTCVAYHVIAKGFATPLRFTEVAIVGLHVEPAEEVKADAPPSVASRPEDLPD